MSKKIIRLKESELKRYIRKIISEQNSPELPDGDNKGAYVKSGEGGGNDLESYKLSRKQKDAENENVRSCGQAMMDFSQIYTRISKDGYRLIGYDSNSKFSNIPVVRKAYSYGNATDKFIAVYGHDLNKSDALYGKTILKMGWVLNNGENTAIKKVYTWPFNVNQVITDFYNMKYDNNDGSKKDINDLKKLKSGQYGDYAPGKKELYNKENPADPNRLWVNEQSSTRQRDPKRIQFFDNLAKQISTKIVGKKYFFGKIGVLDNTSIIVKNYNDRNHSINLSGEPVKEFNLFFNVIRVEEDLYKNEKVGTRVWTGAIQVSAKFVNGKLSPNPIVELWGIKNGKIDFSLNAMIPSKPWTWDMVGGAELWMSSTKFNTQYN